MNAHLLPAWDDPVHDAHATFRCLLGALAKPGTIQTVPIEITGPQPLDAATTAALLALTDFETSVWLDSGAHTPAVESYLRFHCGCPLAIERAGANFAVIANPASSMMLDLYAQGSMDYPDRSTTLLIQVQTLLNGPSRTISGPGIAQTRTLRVARLPENFNAIWQKNQAQFPLGVDIIFCCGNQIVGLPRTSIIHA